MEIPAWFTIMRWVVRNINQLWWASGKECEWRMRLQIGHKQCKQLKPKSKNKIS